MESMYENLMIDIVSNCNTTMFEVRKIVNYLKAEGILDYDILTEYFSEDEEIS